MARPSVTIADRRRMRNALFFEGPSRGHRSTRFWTLLALSAVIAAAGVVADSTATVIGAMIVAPLMTPILGIVLAVVVGDHINLVRSVALVVGGALLVVALGLGFGLLVPVDVVATTNNQVAGRVSPGLIDLIAALATGAVGAFALVREDVGDTLPGVAIAISLVPPLAVVGLTLEAGATGQALGALLLFLTNVAAILASGVAVMWLYRVYDPAEPGGTGPTRRGLLTIAAMVAVVAVPLAVSSLVITRRTLTENEVADVARDWAARADWEVVGIQTQGSRTVVRAIGPLPAPDPAALRRALDERGQHAAEVSVELVPAERVDLPSG